jgi:hypothetical protein
MVDVQIYAELDDGPRAGEVLQVHANPDGDPPPRLVIADPLAMPGGETPRFDSGDRPTAATTYHLHGPSAQQGRYIYRTGEPD